MHEKFSKICAITKSIIGVAFCRTCDLYQPWQHKYNPYKVNRLLSNEVKKYNSIDNPIYDLEELVKNIYVQEVR